MDERLQKLQTFVDNYVNENFRADKIKILEAGCGMKSPVKYKGNRKITGIDISRKQLERNDIVDEKIEGDIQSYPLAQSEYNIIICWDVLEHLVKPELALNNFANSVNSKGLIIIGVPNLFSVKGLLTKYTPLMIHILVYKYIYRREYHSGEDDKGPFKTYLKKSVTYPALKKFAYSNNLQIVYFDTVDVGRRLKNKNKLIHISYTCMKKFFSIVSFGKLGDSDLTIVFSKN